MHIFNTLTHREEEFKPIKENFVGMYVCGPTVYGPDHLGHARTWIFFDFLRRYFLARGYKVKFVQNITDVGHLLADEEEGMDKIEKKAKEEGKTPEEIASFFEAEHFKDLEALNILKPDESPRATEFIPDIIDYIKVLVDKGFAYEADGDIYFSVAKLKSYGELSGRNLDEIVSGTRGEVKQNKKHPADFALWKKADSSHLQKWPSPWGLSRAESRGEGYPGWHIECSVMSTSLLGQPFDLHGSTVEQIFPHHENEQAQARAFSDGKPLANFWVHSGMLTIDGQKMAKSTGNYITVKDALSECSSDVIRLAFLQTSWRKPLDWTKSATLAAQKLCGRLVNAKSAAGSIETDFITKLNAILDDNFNTPAALTLINDYLNKMSKDDFEYLANIFGLKLEKVELTSDQEKLVKMREIARKTGDFKKADEIRDQLEKEGISVQDKATP